MPASIVAVPTGVNWSLLAWGWRDGGRDNTSGQVIVVDLSESAEKIAAMKSKGQIVICYFSVGTIETFRDDAESNKAKWQSVMVGKIIGWDESWLDITNPLTKTLQSARFKAAADKGK